MSQDYTKANANRLRAVTVAGEIANIIRQIQLNPPLPQLQTAGFTFAGTGSQVNCGVSFNPNTVSITIPTGDTGSASATTTATSNSTQNVTFAASWSGAVDPCLGTPTVTPSTYSFTAGGSVNLIILVPYTNCTTPGISAKLTVVATTDSGCLTYMGGGSGQAGGPGGVTTTNNPDFKIQITCNGFYAGCSPTMGTYGGGGSVSVGEWADDCNLGFIAAAAWVYSVTDLNGHVGGATVTCSPPGACAGGNVSCGCYGRAGPNTPCRLPWTSCGGFTTITATDGAGKTHSAYVTCTMTMCGGCS